MKKNQLIKFLPRTSKLKDLFFLVKLVSITLRQFNVQNAHCETFTEKNLANHIDIRYFNNSSGTPASTLAKRANKNLSSPNKNIAQTTEESFFFVTLMTFYIKSIHSRFAESSPKNYENFSAMWRNGKPHVTPTVHNGNSYNDVNYVNGLKMKQFNV